MTTVSDVGKVSAVNHGEVYTKPWLAEWMLDLLGYVEHSDLHDKILLEPACGNGVRSKVGEVPPCSGDLVDQAGHPGRVLHLDVVASPRGYSWVGDVGGKVGIGHHLIVGPRP